MFIPKGLLLALAFNRYLLAPNPVFLVKRSPINLAHMNGHHKKPKAKRFSRMRQKHTDK